MEFLKIIGIGFITIFLCLITKELKPEISMFIGISGSIVILFILFDLMNDVIIFIEDILDMVKIDKNIFKILLKIIAIGYITEFCANFCSDCGYNAFASKIILAGKLVIFVVSIPIFKSLFEVIAGFL